MKLSNLTRLEIEELKKEEKLSLEKEKEKLEKNIELQRYIK